MEVERLIRPEARGGRICVLGAGNCNDLDLGWMVGAYGEVRLVDIDRGAVERGVGRQGVVGKVEIEGPVDLTGVSEGVRSWRGRRVSIEEVGRAVERVNGQLSMVNGGGFDVVLSCCVLSQLLCGVRDVLGVGHAGWKGLKGAIIRRHLRDVVGLTRAGGRGVLAVDVSSTVAIAGLDRAREEEWGDLMRVALNDGKCFRGLEPVALRGVVEGDGELRRLVAEARVSAPWVWHLGWGKAFLCYGLTVVRNGTVTCGVQTAREVGIRRR
jgi:hypothetical protein